MKPNAQQRDQARRLLDSNRPAEALAVLEQALKSSPRDADSLYLAGICHTRSGDHAAAEKCFRRAVKANDRMFHAHADLGLSQFLQKKPGDAIRSFRRSLAIRPDFAPAHHRIALAYRQTGELKKALQHARQSVELEGNNPAFANLQALCHRDLGEHAKAVDCFTRIIAAHPGFYGAYQGLVETHMDQADVDSAESVLLQARDAFAERSAVHLALGGFYEQTRRLDAARTAYAQALETCGERPELLVALGRADRLLGNFEAGLTAVDRALAIDGANQSALAERCAFHLLRKEYEAAFTLLDAFLADSEPTAASPGLLMAYANAARLSGRYDESVTALKRALQLPGITDDMASAMHFSLGESYDKLEKYDRAFASYKKGNAAVSQASDLERYVSLMQAIGDSISDDALANATRSDITSEKPVFIVGMPRSGTSLVEQIISSHPDVHGAGEITELWAIAQDICGDTLFEGYAGKTAGLSQDALNQFAQRYLATIEQLDDSALRITDKLPHNFLHIGLINQLFPNAHIIHCRRHPFDTCLSIYFKKFNDSHVYARDLREIALFYQQYQQLMSRWEATSLRMFSLQYEALVRDQEPVSRALVDHIGLPWDDACLTYYESGRLVTTPSYTQANRPVYTDAINRWKHYRNHLKPLVDVLGDPEAYQ